MWNNVVSFFDVMAGRMMAGVLNLSSDHPVVMLSILALLLVLVCTVWVDLMEIRLDALRRPAKAPRS